MASKKFRIIGLAIAGTGAAHFAAPAAFEDVTKLAFPEQTDEWIKRNGTTELVLGLAVAGERTRKLGLLGLAGYAAWLVSRVLGAKKS